MLFLLLCLLLVQILVTVTRYILSAYLKWFVPSTQIKKDFEFQPSVSVLLPCFNEGKTVYDTIQSIARSDYPHENLEIIAIDDCSVDDSYEWMLKAAQEFSNIKIQVSKNEHNSGKSKTILRS